MNVKELKLYLNFVVDTTEGKSFKFVSPRGKTYYAVFYKLYELDPPFEFLFILDINKNYKYFYEINGNEIVWGNDNIISKQLKHFCDRIAKMFTFF